MMIHLKGLVIALRTPEEIKECLLFTKNYAPMVLDSQGHQTNYCLQLQQNLPDLWGLEMAPSSQKQSVSSVDRCKKRPKRSLNCLPHRNIGDILFLKDMMVFRHANINLTDQQNIVCDAKEDYSPKVKENAGHLHFKSPASQPSGPYYNSDASVDWRVSIFSSQKCTILCNGHFASSMLTAVRSSQTFRRHLFKNLMHKFSYEDNYEWDTENCDVVIGVSYLLDVVAVWPVQRIDYAWGWCMNNLLTKRLLLEEAMAWLSTLGGAHSSLGEYHTHHAIVAGQISMKQLRLAVMMGDPLTIARCHMFWAYSLLQRGHCHKAQIIVRHVYKFATTHSVWDNRLVSMCKSAWARLQYLHRVRRQVKRSAVDNAHKSSVSDNPKEAEDNSSVNAIRVNSSTEHVQTGSQAHSSHQSAMQLKSNSNNGAPVIV